MEDAQASMVVEPSGTLNDQSTCSLVFIQCRAIEWFGKEDASEAWAWEAAKRCMARGFGVVRVPTKNWWHEKKGHPEHFCPLYRQEQNAQHVICTINYIHYCAPMMEKVYGFLQQSSVVDVQAWTQQGVCVHLPQDVCSVRDDLFVVAEASSNVATNLCPAVLRLVYGYYEQPVLWCGFNMPEKLTGSKGVVGDPRSLVVVGECLKRMKRYHIDQEYKALRGAFFELVNKDHICFGYLAHRSQCCDNSQGDLMPLGDHEYCPEVSIPSVAHSKKRQFSVNEALSSALQTTKKVKTP